MNIDYWNDKSVESMYDKHLLRAEIECIKKFIPIGSKLLDAGCGEGEGTDEYADIAGTVIAADFSDTRLTMARERVKKDNVFFYEVDFLKNYQLDHYFDCIVSQRFIINILNWELQKRVIRKLLSHLKRGGRLILLEGWQEGVDELNRVRGQLGMEPIPVRFHNLFIHEDKLLQLVDEAGMRVTHTGGLGEYFLLTRAIRPFFDKDLRWDVPFNKAASLIDIGLQDRCSRLKMWIIE